MSLSWLSFLFEVNLEICKLYTWSELGFVLIPDTELKTFVNVDRCLNYVLQNRDQFYEAWINFIQCIEFV